MAKSWAPEGLNLEDTVWSGVNGDVGIYVGRVRDRWVWAGGIWRLSRASLPAGEQKRYRCPGPGDTFLWVRTEMWGT